MKFREINVKLYTSENNTIFIHNKLGSKLIITTGEILQLR